MSDLAGRGFRWRKTLRNFTQKLKMWTFCSTLLRDKTEGFIERAGDFNVVVHHGKYVLKTLENRKDNEYERKFLPEIILTQFIK